MKRRDFIQKLSLGGAGLSLAGIPLNLLGGNHGLKRLALQSNNDNVLVFIQLHGGNDALNTLIPVSQYNEYYNLRPNIAIPDFGTRSYINVDSSVDEKIQVGLHPDMLSFKEMYDEGKVAVVQNVGYPDMNLSHFRGRDIVFMGGDAQSDYESGWMGRFLDNSYPGYPDAYPNGEMPDPIGLELSGTLSLAFHRENGIPIGLNIGNPEQFYQLISNVGVDPPINLPDSHAGDELRYIMEFEKKSNQYAERLRNVYQNGSNSSVEYPEVYPFATTGASRNPLSGQLKLIARLLKGGIKTRIFLVRIGGFDTHGEQVETYDSTLGVHAALLYHLSSAVKAFYDDLKILGMDHKVMGITFTEFGRRAYSNASYGTDHGTSTPVFLFGTGLNPGIYGQNPDLTDLNNGNLKYEIDYRQIYTSIVQDWFGADRETLIQTGFNEWVDNKLPLIGTTGTDFRPVNNKLLQIYPNPIQQDLNFHFSLEKQADVEISVYHTGGQLVKKIVVKGKFGSNPVTIPMREEKNGIYYLEIKTGNQKLSSSFMKL
jgi:uncharacterized protein (DUF1501 family)